MRLAKKVALAIIWLVVASQFCLEAAAWLQHDQYFTFGAAILFQPVLLIMVVYLLMLLVQRDRRLDILWIAAIAAEALWYAVSIP